MQPASISEHGIIGDMCSAALVSVYGDIDFYCYPDFDSPSVFLSLLHDQTAGFFSVRPAGEIIRGKQIYVPQTSVLLTQSQSPSFLLEVCDWMPMGESRFKHCILRMATVIRGSARVEMLCRPSCDYARETHQATYIDGGVAFAPDNPAIPRMRLISDTALGISEGAATAEFDLNTGPSACFVFGDPADVQIDDFLAAVKQECLDTCDEWKRWAKQSTYKGRWREMVTRSALALKLLTSEKQGSLVAAPTFGLPEVIGGERNWDYRFTWMRDASSPPMRSPVLVS